MAPGRVIGDKSFDFRLLGSFVLGRAPGEKITRDALGRRENIWTTIGDELI